MAEHEGHRYLCRTCGESEDSNKRVQAKRAGHVLYFEFTGTEIGFEHRKPNQHRCWE